MGIQIGNNSFNSLQVVQVQFVDQQSDAPGVGFNSLQVVQVRFFLAYIPVHIACFNSLQVVQVRFILLKLKLLFMFQFLIGSLGTFWRFAMPLQTALFQFLIGSLGTCFPNSPFLLFGCFNSLQVVQVQYLHACILNC